MASLPPADLSMHFGSDLEKENALDGSDHKSATKQQHGYETGDINLTAISSLGLVAEDSKSRLAETNRNMHSNIARSCTSHTVVSKVAEASSICVVQPVLSPHLKEMSSPSPGSSQTSPMTISNLRSTKGMVRPVVRQVASASPERYTTLLLGGVHEQPKAALTVLSNRPKPCIRSVVRVRARRALTLQSGEKSMPFSGDRVPNCSKPVGDLNLSGARLQSAARANLSRSADWPSSSAASIRKRTDEESSYEVPRKSLRQEDRSRSWHSATACLAQLSLQDKERRVSFGKATFC